MNRKTVSILLAFTLLLLSLFTGCATSPESAPEEQKTAVNAAVLKGPTGMSMAWLMNENEKGSSRNAYTFTTAGSPDELTAGLVSGKLDIAAIPTNAAAVLYNKTGGKIRVLAANTLGVLHILQRGDEIKSISDLAGKKLISSGEGTVAQYVLERVLRDNGLDADKDLQIVYASEHTEAVSLLLSGEYDIAVLPEPFVTSALAKDSSLTEAFDLTDEWNLAESSTLVMGVIAARADFIEQQPQAVEDFLAEYADSVRFTNQNKDEAASLIEKYGIIGAEVAKKAIPASHIVFLSGEELPSSAGGFLKALFKAQPSSVGGAVPAEDFYYINHR